MSEHSCSSAARRDLRRLPYPPRRYGIPQVLPSEGWAVPGCVSTWQRPLPYNSHTLTQVLDRALQAFGVRGTPHRLRHLYGTAVLKCLCGKPAAGSGATSRIVGHYGRARARQGRPQAVRRARPCRIMGGLDQRLRPPIMNA